eukprot:173-Rhodomonas_salina.1
MHIVTHSRSSVRGDHSLAEVGQSLCSILDSDLPNVWPSRTYEETPVQVVVPGYSANVEPVPGPTRLMSRESDVSLRHGVRIHGPQCRGK